MSLFEQLETALLLLLALVLSGLIGAERERRDKSAGLRTHILVGLGACLVTVVSKHAFPGGDPARVASNIITGISFLGAGIIIKRRDRAHDLTTAASIWVTAAIGITVGSGAWLLAVISTLLTWFTLFVLFLLRHPAKDKTEKAQHADAKDARDLKEKPSYTPVPDQST